MEAGESPGSLFDYYQSTIAPWRRGSHANGINALLAAGVLPGLVAVLGRYGESQATFAD